MNQVEGYLQQLRSKGRVDSQGEFTVAGVKALGKLGQFLLSETSDWILKVVQAACAAGAPQLQIKQTHHATQFEFVTPRVVDLARFERSLVTSLSSDLEPGMDDLVSALRAVGVGQQRDWVAQFTTPGERALLAYHDDKVSTERHRHDPNGGGTTIVVGVAYPRDQLGKLGGLIRFGEAVQNEHMALLTRARATPIPLYLDGRRLDDLAEPRLEVALQPRVFLGVCPTPIIGKETPLLVPAGLTEIEKGKLKDRLNPYSPFLLRLPPEDRRAGAVVRWYYNYARNDKGRAGYQALPAPSRLFLLRRGVVVGKKSLDLTHPVSADIFLCADALRSDLSGLRVQPESTEANLALQHLHRGAPFLEEVISRLTGHTSRPLNRDLLLYGGIGVLSLFAPVLALKAFTGTVSGLMLALSTLSRQRVVESCVAHLHDFQHRLQERVLKSF